MIKQIAEAEKFDLILQEAVYRSPRIDITDRVLKALAESNSGRRAAQRRCRTAQGMLQISGHDKRQTQAHSLREIAERFGGE